MKIKKSNPAYTLSIDWWETNSSRRAFPKEFVTELHVVRDLPDSLSRDEILCEWDPSVTDSISHTSRIKCVLMKTGVLYLSAEGNDCIYANPISCGLFEDFTQCSVLDGLELINTENVVYLDCAFDSCGYDVESFSIQGIERWNVSNVKSMYKMFANAGAHAHVWNIGDLSNWKINNVIDAECMFLNTGCCKCSFDYISKCGKSNTKYIFKKGNSWGSIAVDAVDEVHFVRAMPKNVGSIVEIFCPVLKADGGVLAFLTDKNQLWVTVGDNKLYANEDSSAMFGYMPNIHLIDGLDLIDTSNVKNFTGAFAGCGKSSDSFKLVGLEHWDTSNVKNMAFMFYYAGHQATHVDIGNISKWNTRQVENMRNMFDNVATKADSFRIDLSTWNVSQCKSHIEFQKQNKVKEPQWP